MSTKKLSPIAILMVITSLALNACGAAPSPSIPKLDKRNPARGKSQSAPNPIFQNSQSNEDNSGEQLFSAPADREESQQTQPYSSVNPATEGEQDKASTGAVGQNTLPHTLSTAPPYHEAPEAAYRDTFFKNYGVNPFVDTQEDRLSTFALDVDTGSYTIARNYLNEGNLPPVDAVRTEEFINYFSHGYPFPSSRDTFGIYIDGAPAPFTETDNYHILRIGIQGYDILRSDRKNVSLTFVIDVSGSMADGGRLELVKDSLGLLIDQLGEEDEVSIIAYTDTAWIELRPTSGARKRVIMDAVNSLYPMASTNAEAGLKLGYKQASRNYRSNTVNRVILLSDGVANVGNTGPGSIWESIARFAAEGITLTTVGVGMDNYNDVLLEQLADNGQGFYSYIDTLEEAEKLFVHDLVGTLQVIALDTKIQVDFNPNVVSQYRLIGYENRDMRDDEFTNDEVDAAEIGAGHSVTALYEIKLLPSAKGQIATVFLRWQDPDTYSRHEITQQIFTDQLSNSFRESTPNFQMTVLIAEFAEILRDSYWAQDNSIQEVLTYAHPVAQILEGQDYAELIDLMTTAAWIDRFN